MPSPTCRWNPPFPCADPCPLTDEGHRDAGRIRGLSDLSGGPHWYEVLVRREGPFWDVMEGRADPPPSAALLGWELIAVDPEAGTIEVAFRATDDFLNPVGVVQGGLLAAMLDDTLGPALVATLGPGEFAPTTDLHVQYLRPARPGRLVGRGRIVRRGRDVGFLAGELLDQSGAVVATATATARIRRQEG
jgi:uncharacterized protein (TIGR00369 family)